MKLYFPEVDTDLTTVVGVLKYGDKHNISRQAIILCMFSEYAKQAFQEKTLSEVTDGYRKSGRRILEILFEYEFICETADGFEIHPEKELDYEKILAEHRGIHENKPEVVEYLNSL